MLILCLTLHVFLSFYLYTFFSLELSGSCYRCDLRPELAILFVLSSWLQPSGEVPIHHLLQSKACFTVVMLSPFDLIFSLMSS